jgi:hypothetical protein
MNMKPLHIALLVSGFVLFCALFHDVYNSRQPAVRPVLGIKALPDMKPDAYLYLGIFSLHLASQKR